jgi:class 3 adenylate cyclase
VAEPVSQQQGEAALVQFENRQRPTGLSIQSKLLIMMLAVSLAASAFIGLFGYFNGRSALENAAIDQLTTIREMRASEIESFFDQVTNDVLLDSNLLMVRQASVAFNEAFSNAQQEHIDSDQISKLEEYYNTYFINQIKQYRGDDYEARSLMPSSPAGRYLQYHYMLAEDATSEGYRAKLELDDAGDGSDWSKARARYNDHFSRLVLSLNYEDFLLFDTHGNVVYTPYAGPDLGINVLSGPYAQTALAQAYQKALVAPVDSVIITDYEWYIPSYDQPTLWVLTPIACVASDVESVNDAMDCNSNAGETTLTGVLAAEIQLAEMDRVMTGDKKWVEQGLGETGEVYLVGQDEVMRSGSRLYLEDPEAYISQLRAAGATDAVLKNVERSKTTVLTQPIRTASVQQALNTMEPGHTIAIDYTGTESIAAFAPVDIDDLEWIIVARIDSSEAFGSATEFARIVIVSLLFICLLISMLSIILARVFTNPIERLAEAVHRVSQGEFNVKVSDNSQDEVGDLARSFNEMSESLKLKQDLVNEQREENERLLYSLMPVPAARKYRDGEEHIATDRPDVAVVFAELIGFDDYTRNMTSEEEIGRLKQIIQGFNDAAERTGVEPMRTLRGGYLASSGLVTPRVDSAYRALEFALEVQSVVDRFNAQSGAGLRVRVGVDTGRVRSGLIDRTKLAYDLWGDAVSLAYRVRDTSNDPGIYVSQAVQERLTDSEDFTKVGTVETKNGQEDVYRVEPR